MELAIVGQPGLVVEWRGATEAELRRAIWRPEADIGAGLLSEDELVLAWSGTICDVEATLSITRDRLVVTHPPRRGCDAMAVTRGVVLTYAGRVDPATIVVDLVDATLIPE